MPHEAEQKNVSREQAPVDSGERYISYLGVRLEKAANAEHAPKKEQYADILRTNFLWSFRKRSP